MSCRDILVDQVTNEAAAQDTAKDCEREGRSWQTRQADTANVHHGFETFSEHSDEREQEHDILLRPLLHALHNGTSVGPPVGALLFSLKGEHELEAPLLLHLVDSQQCDTHDGDDDAGDDAKNTLPDVLSAGEVVLVDCIECTDHACANNEADEKPQGYAKPYLESTTISDGVSAAKGAGPMDGRTCL